MGKVVIKALKGSVTGKVYTLKDNMLFGRTSGDVILNDNLVSDPHAKIEIYPNGKIMLIDQDSKNGIWVDGKSKVKTILEEGSKFSLGDVEFQVVFIKFPEEIWSDLLKKSSSEIQDDTSVKLEAFFTEVHLQFLKGYQQGEICVLVYGPRSFGSESPDGPIFDKDVPGKAFTLTPEKEEVLFETSYSDIVCLNGKSVSQQIIKNEDIISIGSVEIQIKIKSSV